MIEILWSGERAWLRSPLFALAVLALFAATLLVRAAVIGPEASQAWGYDFDAFHTGARMTLEGRLVEAYDATVFRAELYGAEDMYWMYPPHGAMLLAPLGALPYGVGGALLLTALVGVTLGLGRALFGDMRGGNALLLLSVPGLFALILGQVAPLFAALLISSLLVAPRRPLLAGLMLALLTVKPQYGLLVPVFLLVRRDWRVIAAASLGTVVLLLASLACFGAEAWAAWWHHSGGPARDFIYDNLYASMPSVYHYAGFLGAPQGAASVAQGAAILLGAALVALGARLPYLRHIALTLVLTCAVMPYLWFYDWLPVMAAVLIAARAAERFGVPRALLWLLWLVPFASELSEPFLDPENAYALGLFVTQGINAAEIVAVWGTALALAYPAIRTTALPVFAPVNSPAKASGPLSSPS